MYESCFCIHSASPCLLVGIFNLFTFKVIIDTYVPIGIFLIFLLVCFLFVLASLSTVQLRESFPRQVDKKSKGPQGEKKVILSCPTLWDHMDCSLPGSSVHGIF